MTQANQPNLFYKSLKLPLQLIGFLWLVHLVQVIFGWDFGYLGIYPGELFGLKGIFIAPLIHGDFSHLIHNSIPLLVLTTIIMFFYRRAAIKSFFMIYILTGLMVWLLARPVFHIGASGVVYGLVTFVLGNGLFRRNVKSIILALIVLFLYSGMFVGVLPNQEGISWESHLYGAMVGLFTSYFYKEEIEADEVEEEPSWANETEALDSGFFLDRDTFEKTKEERKKESDDFLGGWYTSNSWDDPN